MSEFEPLKQEIPFDPASEIISRKTVEELAAWHMRTQLKVGNLDKEQSDLLDNILKLLENGTLRDGTIKHHAEEGAHLKIWNSEQLSGDEKQERYNQAKLLIHNIMNPENE